MGEAPEQKAPRFGVMAEDLLRYDWQSLLVGARKKECTRYMQLFSAEAKVCEASGDDLGRRVYSLLWLISSFFPDYDYVGNPYGPLWTKPNGDRALMADDLEECDLDALSGTLDTISDPEMRARAGDILWERRHDFKAGEIAVRAFLESAQHHKTDDLWPPYADRLKRAADLSAKIGLEKPLHKEVLEVIGA